MDSISLDSQALPPGTHLHEFIIERVLGSGGFGITYLARDTSLGRQVVIKEFLPVRVAWREPTTGTVRPRHSSTCDATDFEWALTNFASKAETMASLNHPGIVKVLRCFLANSTAYYVMPFINGVTLSELANQRHDKPFSENELRGLLERALNALSYMHECGILHGDIKPENILISHEGEPVFIDFDCSFQHAPSERSYTIIETPGCTPFERLQSRGNVGPWSDLYSLAASMVKIITTEWPPKATDRMFNDQWKPLVGRTRMRQDFSESFLSGLDKGLMFSVDERWLAACEWSHALMEDASSNNPKTSHYSLVIEEVPIPLPSSQPMRPSSIESTLPLSDLKECEQHLATGYCLEEFVIERVLGSGGFGITYLAHDKGLKRQVVIKENLPVDFAWRNTETGTVQPRHNSDKGVGDYEWALKNFLSEAETLAALDHPGIVKVLRKFKKNGTAYFAMPFHEGWAFNDEVDLRRTNGTPFSEDEILGFLEYMLDALAYLHAQEIYHRDIKPANILLSKKGIPILIDFGAARQMLSERSMTVIESPGYTPFEQTQSRGNVGPWSDLYALGCTVFKAITYETPPKVNDRALDDSLIPLASRDELLARYSKHLLGGVDRAMAVRIENRWQSATEWLEFVGRTC